MTRRLEGALALFALGAVGGVAVSQRPASEPVCAKVEAPAPNRPPDVIYVPTPQPVVDAMLDAAGVGPDDVLYDLGSGDGRIVISAAQRFGTRGVGIDIDPQRILEARQNAEAAGVSDRVEFLNQDLFEADLSDATVIALYLLPDLNLKLRPKLQQLAPGTRIVSHSFDMGDWKPDEVLNVEGRVVYLWIVPERQGSPEPQRR